MSLFKQWLVAKSLFPRRKNLLLFLKNKIRVLNQSEK